MSAPTLPTDTAAAVHVTDHPFTPPEGAWWGLCAKCNLGEAAHAETTLTAKRPGEGDRR